MPMVKLAGHSIGREFSKTEAAEFFSSAQIGIGSVILTCLVFVVVSLFFPDQPAKDSVVDWDQESEGEAI